MSKTIAVGIVLGAALAPGFTSIFTSAGKEMQGLGRTLKDAKLGASLTGEVAKYKAQLDELRARQAVAGHGNVELNRKIAETQRQFRAAADEAKKYGFEIGDAARQHKLFQTAAAQAQRRMDRAGARKNNAAVRSEAGGQIVGTLGAAYVAIKPVMDAVAFESTMADVRKVVDFDSAEEFKGMGGAILAMSARIPMAAKGLADIVAAGGQSGVAKAELLDFAEAAAKMGVAFDLSGADAGKMMTDWRAGMGLTHARAVKLADAVNHLSNATNAEAAGLGEVIQRQGAVAMSAGLTEIQTAALGSAFLSAGASPEIAATGMKNFTNALTKAGAMSKSQRGAFESLGLNPESIAKSMQKDAPATIQRVLQAVAKAPAWKQSSLVSTMFGEESKGAIMPLLKNMDLLKQSFELTADESKYLGSMQAEYDTRSATTANNLQLLGNRMTRLGVTVGSVFLPGVNAAVNAVAPLVDLVALGAERFPGLAKFVGGAAVGLIAFKVASLAARFGVTLVSDGVLAARAAFDFFRPSVMMANAALIRQRAVAIGSAVAQRAQAAGALAVGLAQRTMAVGTAIVTAAQWALNAAWAASPIGLVIAGVVALGAAGWALYTYWEPIKTFFSGLWESVSSGLGQTVTGVMGWLGSISLFESGAAMIGTLVDGVMSKGGALFDSVKSVFDSVWSLFAHSDADAGPFADLTASGRAIPQTLGQGIQAAGAGPLTSPLGSIFQAAADVAAPAGGSPMGAAPSGAGQTGAPIQITYSPTINVPPGTPQDMTAAILEALRQGRDELRRELAALLSDMQRTSYA